MTHLPIACSSYYPKNDPLGLIDEDCSDADKLIVLSRILSEYDQSESDSMSTGFGYSAVNFVQSTLRSTDDRFVIYSAQKLLVEILKRNCCQVGLQVIHELLNNVKDLEMTCTGLQICRQLLSKQSCHRYTMFSSLSSSILNIWNILMITTDSAYLSQCFYETCSILIKVTKMSSSRPAEVDFESFFKQILLSEHFCEILFHKNFKKYVKSKLIQFLCSVLKLGHNEVNGHLVPEKMLLSANIFKKICSEDLRSIYVHVGTRTFVGMQRIEAFDEDHDSQCTNYNMSHIREWTYLVFTISSFLTQKQENVAMVTAYLSEVDKFLQHLLNVSLSLPFPWLPQVYCDQDDAWIDVLLLVLDIYPVDTSSAKPSSEDSAYRWQHHMHFLHFVGMLGYDHLVLIDLLTSPETNCLSYITKYLKVLRSSWSEFIRVTETLGNVEDVEGNCLKSSFKEPNTCISITKNMCAMAIDNCDIEVDPTQISNCLLTEKAQMGNGEINSEHVSGSSCKGGGLALILGAYNNDSDSSDTDSCDVEDSGLKTRNRNPDTDEDKVKCIDSCCSETKETLKDKDMNYSKIENDESIDTVSDQNGIEDSFDDSEVESENYEFDNYDASKYENVLKKLTDEADSCVSVENELLDKSMSMLIRTRLNLEKLRDSGLLSYNPSVLIHLISAIEVFYEEND